MKALELMIIIICIGVPLICICVWLFLGLIEKHRNYKKSLKCCLGIHKPNYSKIGFNGYSHTSVCERCKEELLEDSEGNWFSSKDYE